MEKNKDTLGLHTFMQNRKTLFCYSGPLTEDLLTTISNPVRHQLSDDETKETVAKRVFGVFIEQAQNIIRYSTQKTKSTGDSIGTIAISVADDGFLIEAVNKIDESKKDVLEATLVELSVADQKALRQMYKQSSHLQSIPTISIALAFECLIKSLKMSSLSLSLYRPLAVQ